MGCMTKHTFPKFKRSQNSASKRANPIKLVLYAAIVMFVVSGLSLWYVTANSSDNVFWGMVNNNLQTAAYTRSSSQDDGQQKAEQITEAQTSPQQLANGRTTITQYGDTSARVVTESIGTPYADYVRYTQVETSQKNEQGKSLDFSQLINVWGKSEAGDGATNGQLFNESVLGIVPMGRISAPQRQELIAAMKAKNVYQFVAIESQRHGLRTTYTYDVKVNPVPYIEVLKQFARDMGLNQLESIDPNQYKSTQPIGVGLKVDSLSHQLLELSYGAGSRTEKMSSYGSLKKLQSPPTDTISIDELQYRLQSVQ